jgi:uncharacterized protein (TIGR02996 family)
MPRYERGVGPGKVLWEIEVDGCRWRIRYGKASAKQLDTYSRDHATPEIANVEAERLIAQRVSDGYRLVSEEPLARVPAPASELELQLRANPDDDAVYLVLADSLQAQEHPRGHLMAIHHRLAQATGAQRSALLDEEAALVARHRFELLGPLAQLDERRLDARWHRGYLEDIHIAGDRRRGITGVRALRALLELPDAHFLRSLRLGIPDPSADAVFDDIVEQVAANARNLPRLVRLFVGDFEYPDETEMSWAHLGPLAALYAAYPGLEQLIVQGGDFELGTLALPALRHLEVRTGGLSAANWSSITRAELPELEALIVWIGDPDHGAAVELADLEPVLSTTAWPKLRHLGLCNAMFADEICTALARAPIAARLEVLDLSLGTMTDRGAAQLARGAFPRLRELDVTANFLTDAALERLRALGIDVISRMQKTDYGGERYVSVGE